MRYMLDTNICIYLIKHDPAQVKSRYEAHPIQNLCVSAVTVAEMEYGVAKSAQPGRNGVALQAFLAPLTVFPFDAQAAKMYGGVRAALERTGKLIGPLDLMIAAHALSLGAAVVTNNVREFARVPGLAVENWLE